MDSFRSRVLGRALNTADRRMTIANLNIRQGPGVGSDTLDGDQSPLPAGTEVEVLDAYGGWVLVSVERVGKTYQGWVSARYLRDL